MKFREIATRLTGFNVPVFGVSWNPPEPEIAVARRVLAFLGDRRVLFNPYHVEVVDQCIQSVAEIRRYLTDEIGNLPSDSKLAEHLQGVRTACRRFLDGENKDARRVLRPYRPGPFEAEFFTSLGELRASIGHRIAAIALMYGLDVEEELAQTLPEYGDKGDDVGPQGAYSPPASMRRPSLRLRRASLCATRAAT